MQPVSVGGVVEGWGCDAGEGTEGFPDVRIMSRRHGFSLAECFFPTASVTVVSLVELVVDKCGGQPL